MRVVVTGAAGFIGSHVCEALVADGDEVFGVDDLRAGNERNLSAVLREARFRLFACPVSEASIQPGWPGGIDGVVHLAALVGVGPVRSQAATGMMHNCAATQEALHIAASGCGVGRARFVLASSCEVYGASVVMDEADGPRLPALCDPRWLYAYGKAFDEAAVLGATIDGTLSGVVARVFNAAGPRQRWETGAVVPSFVRAARQGEPCVVNRLPNGDVPRRRFTHVKDTASALVMLLRKGEPGLVYNVADPEAPEVQMDTLARIVWDVAGTGSYRMAYRDAPFADVARRTPVVRRLPALGWRPEHAGLTRIVEDAVQAPEAQR